MIFFSLAGILVSIKVSMVKFTCPLCDATYDTRCGALAHIRKAHKKDEGKEEALAQVPYEVCPHCKEPKSNLWST